MLSPGPTILFGVFRHLCIVPEILKNKDEGSGPVNVKVNDCNASRHLGHSHQGHHVLMAWPSTGGSFWRVLIFPRLTRHPSSQ